MEGFAKMSKNKIQKLYVYIDGGSRGNPGNSAIAFMIYDEEGNVISKKSKGIGRATNNSAEYKALIFAMEEAVNYSQGEIFCFSDSKLLVNQLEGKFKVKRKHLKELFLEIKNKEKMYKRVAYSKLPRANPKIAGVDKLVNEELDKLE